jgi:hypothetical protein
VTLINNIHDNPRLYNLEPYVLVDGITGNTRYTGISLSSGDINNSI